MITGLQEALPKSIGLLPFDAGVTGMVALFFFVYTWKLVNVAAANKHQGPRYA